MQQQPMRVLAQQQVSPEATQFAATYQLGVPQNEYRVRLKKSTIIYMIIVLLLGVISLASALGSDQTEGMVTFLIVGLVFIGAGIYLALTPVIYGSWRVYICSDGFAFRRGKRIDAFRWDQVESIRQAVTRRYYYGIYTGTTHRYTIRRKDGVQIALRDQFADVEQIGNTLSNAITQALFPQVLAAYNAGQTITFGSLSVSLQGVSNNNGQTWLPWNQIKEIKINRGVISVRQEGKWLNWSTAYASRIPNISVFLALVNYVLKNRQ